MVSAVPAISITEILAHKLLDYDFLVVDGLTGHCIPHSSQTPYARDGPRTCLLTQTTDTIEEYCYGFVDDKFLSMHTHQSNFVSTLQENHPVSKMRINAKTTLTEGCIPAGMGK